MRLIVIGILVVLLLLTIIVPLVKKKKPSLFTAAIILIPAVALGYFEHTWIENQEKLQASFRQATEISVAKVSCERMSVEWFDAFISVNEAASDSRAAVKLKHSSCAPLFSYLNAEDKNSQKIDNTFTGAVLALSEAGVKVTNPEYDSQKVRCVAVQRIPGMVAALGGTEKQAYFIQEHYKNNMKNAKLTTQVC